MIWLQSNESFDTIAQFDPVEISMTEYSRHELMDAQPEKPDGFFSVLGGRRIAFYGRSGRLFLLVDDRLLGIQPTETIEVTGPREARHLVVMKGQQVVFETVYSLTETAGPIPGDVTPFVEAEDFDIGLFASNVSKDPQRRALFSSH